MKQFVKKIVLVIGILIFLATGCDQFFPSNSYTEELKVGSKKIFVEIAQTPEKRSQGLSGRERLKNNQGMLFIFDSPSSYSFWMKEMKFNIDIIWISQGKIIGVTANVPAPNKNSTVSSDQNLPFYSPPSPVDMVLEVNANWSKENKINIGDEIKLKE